MLELIGHYIIQFIESTKYTGIFILMALESALIPIPSEITMPFSGFLASSGKLSFWLVVATGTVANLAGSYLAYFIGYFLEEAVLVKLIKNHGKFILVSHHDYERAKKWFEKYGDKIIFISRLLPGIRTFSSIVIGASSMRTGAFVGYTLLGSFLWNVPLAFLGYVFGARREQWEPYYRGFEEVIIGVIIIGVAVFLFHRLRSLWLESKANVKDTHR